MKVVVTGGDQLLGTALVDANTCAYVGADGTIEDKVNKFSKEVSYNKIEH